MSLMGVHRGEVCFLFSAGYKLPDFCQLLGVMFHLLSYSSSYERLRTRLTPLYLLSHSLLPLFFSLLSYPKIPCLLSSYLACQDGVKASVLILPAADGVHWSNF